MLDSVDGKLDLSRFLIEMHGFIPVPFLITEPALGGFGLGLYLVKKYVEVLGGEIQVNSRLGESSSFTLQIPAPVDTSAATPQQLRLATTSESFGADAH